MLSNPSFEAQIDDVTPIQVRLVDFDEVDAQHFMGDYSPQGIRMSKNEFLDILSFNKLDIKK